jgi:MFS family permease
MVTVASPPSTWPSSASDGALNTFLLLPLYIQRLGGDEADIGLVQGLYSAAGIVCQPVVGALIDYLGRRFFMRLGAVLLVVSCALFVLASPLPLLGVLRILQGVAFSAFFVSNYIHVVEMVPAERRGWALGIFGLSGLVSTSLAPLAVHVRRWLSHVLHARPIAAAPDVWGVQCAPARPPACRTEIARAAAHAWAVVLGCTTIFTFLPTFGEDLGITSVGLFYTAYAAAAMLVRVVGGNLIDVRGRRAVIIPCMFVQAAATCIIALVAILFAPALRLPVLPFLFLAGFLAGAAHGFLYPAMSALLMDVTPERRRGSAVGIFSSVILVGNSFGAIAFGYVAHGLGYAVMWSALTVLLIVGSFLSVRLRVGYARPVTAPAPAS